MADEKAPETPGALRAPKAPPREASKEEHKKHAEEFLALEEFKQKPEGYQDVNDEAKP